MNSMKVKASDSVEKVPNENVVTHLVSDRQTNQQSDQLLELLEWLFATKKLKILIKSVVRKSRIPASVCPSSFSSSVMMFDLRIS